MSFAFHYKLRWWKNTCSVFALLIRILLFNPMRFHNSEFLTRVFLRCLGLLLEFFCLVQASQFDYEIVPRVILMAKVVHIF